MRINVVVNPVFDGWSPWDTRLGGTEESVVEWTVRLKSRGHDVSCFHNGRHGQYLGVDFIDRSRYPDHVARGGGPSVTLNCNYPDLPVLEKTVYFNNLVDGRKYDLSKFEAIIHPSNYARAELGISHPNQEVVPHGYDPKYIYPEEKIPQSVLYASSPDRGLSELEKAWPEVIKAHPNAQLIVTYNGRLDLPNVLPMGNCDSTTMAELYRSSDIWCHPALGGELFGITAVKAQVAKCWPVYYPIMALNETVKFGAKTDHEHLAQDLIAALHEHPEPPTMKFADWDDSTDQLEKVLEKYS